MYINVTHCRVNALPVFFFHDFNLKNISTVLKRDCFASRDNTVSSRVWFSKTISAGRLLMVPFRRMVVVRTVFCV